MQKGFLSTLLALCIALALLPVTALAETVASGEWGADGDNVTWTHDSNGTLTIRGTGRMADSLAPWWNQYYPIDTVVIEDGVTSIGEEAFFYNSWGIKNISIPDSVTRIGANAFHGCGEMKSITLPKNLKNIDGSLFTSCESLQEFKVDSENPDYKSVDGVLFSKDGTTLIKHPCGKAGTYTIPDGVTSLGFAAFAYSGLETIVIPDSLTCIEGCMFSNSGLSSITIPDSVTSIEYQAFSDCPKLLTIAIPASVNSIGRDAFGGCCNMTDLYYGGSEQQWLAAGGPVEIYGDSTTIHFDILQKTTDSLSPVREHFSITEVLCACFEQIRTIFGFTHKNGTDR